MKTNFLKSIFALIVVATLIISCGPPPPPGLEEFFYAENNSPTSIYLDAPDASAGAKKIIGKSSGGSTIIDINLNSLAVGTYTLGSGNEFVYKKPGTTSTWTGLTGTVTITINSGGFLSGSFDIKRGIGIPSVNLMKGNFSNVIINP
ncbi:MAG TPA: hypothetical protein PLP39_05810 [Flavobacterium lutivivi]|nr:hypothetical protein [Flavobacterium lutivivi]